MNYLFHLHLAGDDADLLAGGFAGDFVKGRLSDSLPAGFRRGIELHRLTDSFAQRDPAFRQSRQRLAPEYGLYRGVMVDLFYDHFLAVEWHNWHEEPLQEYLVRVRGLIEGRSELLPQRLQELVPLIFGELIPSYHHPAGIGRALLRMSGRLRRPNPLGSAGGELTIHYRELRSDFCDFLPRAMRYASDLITPPE